MHQPVASFARRVRQGKQPQNSRARSGYQSGSGEGQAVVGNDQRRDQVTQSHATRPGEGARFPTQGHRTQRGMLADQAGTPTQRKGTKIIERVAKRASDRERTVL